MHIFTNLAPSLLLSSKYWKAAQFCIVVATGILIGLLFQFPGISVKLFWNILIPLLPLTFLITPILWRSLCPLATLNMLSNGSIGRRKLKIPSLPHVGNFGLILLVIMVPARRFLFNEHGAILAATILLVAVTALALGAVFDAKAGFCNTICPVLPVEKLYGQHPLWEMRNPRCKPCTLCTPKGCVDLAPKKAITRAIGKTAGAHAWLKTGYGMFAAAFPGFILGYFVTPNTSIAFAGTIYLQIAFWALGSYLITTSLVRLTRQKAASTLPILAAASIGIYYWFTAPLVLSVFGPTALSVMIFRSVLLAIIGFWLGRALNRVQLTGPMRWTSKLPLITEN